MSLRSGGQCGPEIVIAPTNAPGSGSVMDTFSLRREPQSILSCPPTIRTELRSRIYWTKVSMDTEKVSGTIHSLDCRTTLHPFTCQIEVRELPSRGSETKVSTNTFVQ